MRLSIVEDRDFNRGDLRSRLRRLRRSVPRQGLPLFSLGLVLLLASRALAVEKIEDSKRFYEKVVQVQPGNANAQFDLGNVYLSEKRYEDALSHYKKVGNSGLASSRMDNYYFNVAVCYAGLGRMGDAVSSLEQCIRVNPNHQEARDLLAIYKNALSP